jgi:hypothetical protein
MSTHKIDLGELATQAMAIQEEINERTERLESIKSLMRNVLPPGETDMGDVSVTVAPNYRFDTEVAGELINSMGDNELALKVMETVVSSKLAKQHLSPDMYQKCQRQYPNNKISFKRTD